MNTKRKKSILKSKLDTLATVKNQRIAGDSPYLRAIQKHPILKFGRALEERSAWVPPYR
jgi:hypothetical protein